MVETVQFASVSSEAREKGEKYESESEGQETARGIRDLRFKRLKPFTRDKQKTVGREEFKRAKSSGKR